MTAGIFNRYANRANLVSGHARFKLSRDDAHAIALRASVGERDRDCSHTSGL
jgi:hypothetical protein